MQTDTSGPGGRGWGQTSPCLASPAPGPWGCWELRPGTGRLSARGCLVCWTLAVALGTCPHPVPQAKPYSACGLAELLRKKRGCHHSASDLGLLPSPLSYV